MLDPSVLAQIKSMTSGGAAKPKIDASGVAAVLAKFKQDPVSAMIAKMFATDPTLPKLGDILQRPSAAMLARHARGGAAGLQTLLHSDSPAQYASDRQNAIMDWYKTFGQPSGPSSPMNQAIANVVIPTLYDPTIVGGQLGLGEKAMAAGERYGLPLAMAAANKPAGALVKGLMKVHPGAADAANTVLTGLGHIPSALHENFGVDSLAKQQLASQGGFNPNWLSQYNKAASVRQGTANVGTGVSQALQAEYNAATKGLSEREYLTTVRALDGGHINLLPPKLKDAALRMRGVFRSMPGLQGNKTVQRMLGPNLWNAGKGFELPDYAKPFQNIVRQPTRNASQFRADYHPIPFGGDGTFDIGATQSPYQRFRRQTFNPLTVKNANLRARTGEARIVNDAALYKQSAADAIENFGREFAAGAGKKQLRNAFASVKTIRGKARLAPARFADIPSAVRGSGTRGQGGMFAREFTPDDQMTRAEKGWQFAKTATDFNKGIMFGLPFPHMGNITGLLALHSPTAVPKALALYAKMIRMSPREQYNLLREPIEAGAISLRNVERQSPFISALQSTKATKGIGKWYAGSSKQVWTFDDAAKAVYYDELRAKGMSKADAAAEVQSSLVDYNRRAPASEAARALVPFATWRTKMPLAVARGLVKHPEYAAFAQRVNPMATGAVQNKQQNYGPLAEFGRGVSSLKGLADYGRSTAGPVLKAAGSVAGNIYNAATNNKSKSAHNWATYGANPIGYAAAESTPVGYLLDLLGVGPVSGRKNKGKTFGQIVKGMPQNVLNNLIQSTTRTYPTGGNP